MNAAAVWSITGATIDRRQRTVIWASWAGATLLALVFARTADLVVPMIAYAIGLGFWWAFVVGRSLLLQRDARNLCLPDVDALVAANLALQFAATALLPAVIIAALTSVDFLRVAALFSCIATGALMLQTLPRTLAMWFSIVPISMQQLHARGLIPGLGDPAFIPFGWTLAAVMLAVALWRWRSILATVTGRFGEWSVPLVIQMQRRPDNCESPEGAVADAKTSASPQGRAHQNVVLDRVGPTTPLRAIRVLLGGTFAPKAPSARMAQTAFALLPMSGTIVFHWIAGGTMAGWTTFAIVVAGAIIPLITMSVAPLRLARLRNDAGGEIAELALLPGLGGQESKRNLLRAVLGAPLSACACVYLFALAACFAAGNGWLIAALTFSTVGAVAFGVVQTVAVASGGTIFRPALHAVFLLGIVLICATPAFLPLRGDGSGLGPSGALVLLGWGMLYALLAWLGARSLEALESKPHAFLIRDQA